MQHIVIKVIEFRGISFECQILIRHNNVNLNQSNLFEGNQALKSLDKKHHALVTNVFANENYLTFAMRLI